MNISIFVCLLFLLQGFYWLVGKRASENLKDTEDYFLAGKTVRFFPLMMTFLATQVGGGIILGSADEAFRFGWPVLLYPLGAALGLILLGSGVGRKLAEFKISTVAELFEVAYQSRGLRKLASALSVISLFMILVAQIIASNKFLVTMGLTNMPLFIIFWAVVIIYTTQGGLKAVISTDIVQATFFSSIFLFCFGWVYFTNPSVGSLQLPEWQSLAPVSSKLFGWLLLPLLFMIIEQDMGQRCFAGASPKVVSKAALVAGIGTLIVCVVPVFFGSLAATLNLNVPQGGSVLMAAIIETTNPWVSALVGCAILAAIISTATSLINAISSNLSSDFEWSLFKNIDSMKFVKGITCSISIAAIFFAFYFDNIVDVLIQSYELSVSCLFIPIAWAIYNKRGNYLSACLSIAAGASAFIIFKFYPIAFPKEVASVLISALAFALGELLITVQSNKRQTI